MNAVVRRKLIASRVGGLLTDLQVVRPPVPVERIARRLGATIVLAEDEGDMSGFLLRDTAHRQVVIGVNRAHPRYRQRFTIAHELGHLVLHRGEGVHVDQVGTIFRINRRDRESGLGEDLEEREANLFAAELLMPPEFVHDTVRGLQPFDDSAVARLASQFNVSPQAMTFRLAYLGYSSG